MTTRKRAAEAIPEPQYPALLRRIEEVERALDRLTRTIETRLPAPATRPGEAVRETTQ